MHAKEGRTGFRIHSGDTALTIRSLIAASVVIVCAAAIFLITRRIAGAFALPLPPAPLAITAVAMAAWAIAVREFTSRTPGYLAAALFAIALFGVACSYPGARVIDWLVWPAAMFAIVLLPPGSQHVAPSTSESVAIRLRAPADDEFESELLLQQVTRSRAPDGHEVIRGTLTGEIFPGERQVTLYVAFCPPFECLPVVEASVIDDMDATVKLAQVLHNGAQFELRLSEPAEEAIVVAIEFSAVEA